VAPLFSTAFSSGRHSAVVPLKDGDAPDAQDSPLLYAPLLERANALAVSHAAGQRGVAIHVAHAIMCGTAVIVDGGE